MGRALAGKLSALGVDAHAVAQVSAGAAGVVFARGLLARDSQDEAIAVQRAALEAARALARASVVTEQELVSSRGAAAANKVSKDSVPS